MTSHVHYYPFYERVWHWFIPHAKNGYRPHALRHKALATYSLILIAAKVVVSIALFLTFPNEASFSTLTAQRVVDLTNLMRARVGIPALQVDERLELSAQLKADDMAIRGYFAHKGPRGESPWEWFKAAGYEYTYAGENLAMDFREAEEVVEAWMESPKHRENLLNPKYRNIGIAVTTGKINGKTVTLVVQHFGTTYVGEPRLGGVRARPLPTRAVRGETAVAAEGVEVRLIGPYRVSIADLIDASIWAFGVLAVGFAMLLFLNLVIHIRIQHRGMIIASITVLALTVGLIYLKIHFLEQVDGAPIVFSSLITK